MGAAGVFAPGELLHRPAAGQTHPRALRGQQTPGTCVYVCLSVVCLSVYLCLRCRSVDLSVDRDHIQPEVLSLPGHCPVTAHWKPCVAASLALRRCHVNIEPEGFFCFCFVEGSSLCGGIVSLWRGRLTPEGSSLGPRCSPRGLVTRAPRWRGLLAPEVSRGVVTSTHPARGLVTPLVRASPGFRHAPTTSRCLRGARP